MKRRARAHSTWRSTTAAALALALALAGTVVAAGCGGGGGDNGTQASVATHESKTSSQTSSTKTSTTKPSKKPAAKPAHRHDRNSRKSQKQPAGNGGPIAKRYQRFRGCLAQHGLTRNSTPQPGGGQPAQFEKRLEKVRSALEACRNELPQSIVPNGFGQGAKNPPHPPSAHERRQAQHAAEQARQRLQSAQAFRSCLAQHGLGSGASSTPTPDQVRKAYADCESELSG